MLTLILFAMALLALGCLLVVRYAVRAESGGDAMVIADRPKTTYKTDTGGKGSSKGSTLTLRVPDPKCACEFARRIVGKTFEPEVAPKLPLAGCGLIECRCRFVATTDRRSKVRREKEERRDMIRFETKSGRREVGGDRRKSNTRWTGPR